MTVTLFAETQADFIKTKYSRSEKVDKPIKRVRHSSTNGRKRRMSLPTEEKQDVDKPWFRRKRVWVIGALIVLLIAGLIFFVFVGFGRTPDVGGGLTIEADPDTKIYIGDKLVGMTQVSFSWSELFGDERHEALAEKLPHASAVLRPELVIEPGSEILNINRLGIVGTSNVNFSGSGYLIRRPDGVLDQIFTFLLDWSPPNQPSGRYLLPVRLRKGTGASTAYFTSDSTGISASSSPEYMRLLGKSPNTSTTISKFTAKRPPPEFAEELRTKGLWEPAADK
jgi:hypothetical protein